MSRCSSSLRAGIAVFLLCLVFVIMPVAAGTGLANSAWPKFGHDLNNTGLSSNLGSQTGSLKWTYTAGDWIAGSPAIGSDGTIYVGSWDNNLYALNPDGTVKWSYTTGGSIWSSPAISANGSIYVGSDDDNVYALNPDGTLKWTFATGNVIRAPPSIGADGTVYVGSYDQNLYALNPDGTLKWTYATGNIIQSSPAIDADGTIYVPSDDGNVYAINPDGSLKWTYSTGNGLFGSAAIGADGILYFGCEDNNLYALNPDGSLKWTYTTGSSIDSSPAIGADGTIYIGSEDNNIYAINPDGSLKWTYPTGGLYTGSPAIGADGTIYIGGWDNNVYAITPNGSLNWIYTMGAQIRGSPAIGPDGTVYVGSYDQNLYAFTGTVTISANQTSGGSPLPVQFTGTSAVTATSWNWDFGDGSTGTGQNPSHTYTSSGSYTVNLTVTDTYGTHYVIQPNYITVSSPPVANFTSDVTSGVPVLSVQFTDTSTGSPTSWLWNFGDGGTSTDQNPVYAYSVAGIYNVTLTATNTAGSNTTTIPGYITVSATPPVISFTASPRVSTAVPLTVQFTDTSTLGPTSWSWNFGDGSTSTDQNPVHTYTALGNYTVSLSATNGIGTNASSKPGFVTLVTQKPLPAQNDVTLYVANGGGVKYDTPNGVSADAPYQYIPDTYFLHMSGGLNPLAITDGSNDVITTTKAQSGTFYLTFSGGQPTMPDAILMLAVNGTIPDDFTVHIRSSGNSWTPAGPATSNAGVPATYNYVNGAVDETFNKSDFIYGPQIWKPCSVANYPIFSGQNMSDTGNTFQIMFIDLNVGAIEAVDGSSIKVDYSFNNLTSFAAFNDYGWYYACNHGTGIVMTNDLSKDGYSIIGIPAAPVASFTSSSNSSDYFSPVQFTDTSTNVPQSWSWDFGDGTTSTVQNPTHTYSAPGTYTVQLTVTNIKGTNTTQSTVTKIIPPVPTAGFTANPTTGTSPLPVQFTDQSTGTVVSWLWDFGDGTNSTAQNPVHWYGGGTYTVNLTVSNSGGSNSAVKSSYITVNPTTAQNRFSNPGFETGTLANWTTGTSGVTISSSIPHTGNYAAVLPGSDGYLEQYIDMTNVTNISYWGYSVASYTSGGHPTVSVAIDGTTVQTSPVTTAWVQYTIPLSGYSGAHLVTVTFDQGIESWTGYFDDFWAGSGSPPAGGTASPTASFTATPVSGTAPLAVQFTDTSTGSPTSWSWNFGDGTTSTVKNPSHTYTNAGTYAVALTATNAGGSTTMTKSGFVYVAASAGALPGYNGIFIRAANHDGILRDVNGNGTYYIAPGSANGGLSAVHVSTDPAVTAGQVTVSKNQSGTFYITANSGTYEDEAVLLLSVNGTVPDDFAAHIRTGGYTWTPTGSAPASGSYAFQSPALDQSFTKNDFFYGPQNWKPTQGNANYPLVYGENMSSPQNQERLMFIDTRAGILSDGTLTNNGAVRVDYSFTDLPGTATFNVYGWRSSQGMQWTNDVTTGGASSSGFTTIGAPVSSAPPASVSSGGIDNSDNGPDSGSGSGSGGTSTLTSTVAGANPGQTVSVPFNQVLGDGMPLGIDNVQIVTAEAIGSTQVILHDASSADVLTVPDSPVAGIEQIEFVGTNPSAIDHGTITFSLTGSWLRDHNLTPADIVMLREHDSAWNELPTSFDHQDGDTYYFTATTPGFSYFAVAGRGPSKVTPTPAATSVQSNPTMASTPDVTAGVPAAEETTSIPAAIQTATPTKGVNSLIPTAVTIVAVVLVAVAAVGSVVWWRRRRDPLRWDRK